MNNILIDDITQTKYTVNDKGVFTVVESWGNLVIDKYKSLSQTYDVYTLITNNRYFYYD